MQDQMPLCVAITMCTLINIQVSSASRAKNKTNENDSSFRSTENHKDMPHKTYYNEHTRQDDSIQTFDTNVGVSALQASVIVLLFLLAGMWLRLETEKLVH